MDPVRKWARLEYFLIYKICLEFVMDTYKKISEYDQEIQQSHTADQPTVL